MQFDNDLMFLSYHCVTKQKTASDIRQLKEEYKSSNEKVNATQVPV